jgi:hypothetical protein
MPWPLQLSRFELLPRHPDGHYTLSGLTSTFAGAIKVLLLAMMILSQSAVFSAGTHWHPGEPFTLIKFSTCLVARSQKCI